MIACAATDFRLRVARPPAREGNRRASLLTSDEWLRVALDSRRARGARHGASAISPSPSRPCRRSLSSFFFPRRCAMAREKKTHPPPCLCDLRPPHRLDTLVKEGPSETPNPQSFSRYIVYGYPGKSSLYSPEVAFSHEFTRSPFARRFIHS